MMRPELEQIAFWLTVAIGLVLILLMAAWVEIFRLILGGGL